MLSVKFDWGPALAKVANLERVINESLRPAAQAAAQVFYDEVRTRALSVGRSRRLQAAIYQKWSPEFSVNGRQVYKVSWRKQRAQTNVKAAPSEDAGLPYSTMGYWIEFGHMQRYAAYIGKDGEWHTAVRADKKGTKPPARNASQAVKDAYYVLRPGGPVFWLPRSFLRSSYDAKQAQALQAAQTKLQQLIEQALT